METLARALNFPLEPFEELIQNLSDTRSLATLQPLSVESAQGIIDQYQKLLDQLILDLERYDDCQVRLLDPAFDSATLAKILNDDSLRSRFEKMQILHHRLVDAQNWTEKEQVALKNELETDKRFIMQELVRLKEGALLHIQVLKERLLCANHTLLYLLLDLYNQTKRALSELEKQSALLSQRWLTAQKGTLQARLYTEMMESITKMIEAKNIGYNIDYLMSNALEQAHPPILPDNPKLFLKGALGGFGGVLCFLLGLFTFQVWKGPSASFENLSSQGRIVIPKKEAIPHLGVRIGPANGSTLVICSKQKRHPACAVIDWLTKKGEKAFVMDFTATPLPDYLATPDREAFLTSRKFEELLTTLKSQYERLVIIAQTTAESCQMETLVGLADCVVFGVTNERLDDLANLNSKTLFFVQPRQNPMLSLHSIKPLLAQRMKRSSFSWKTVLLRFLPEKFAAKL